MKYRNVKTGAVIEVNSKLGGDWVPVAPAKTEKAAKTAPTKKGTKKK